MMCIMAEVWEGATLKLTFRRNFSVVMMENWYELEQIVSNIRFSEDIDSLVCQYTKSMSP